MGDAHRIGIVGLGSISAAYLGTLADSSAVEITAVADLDAARARHPNPDFYYLPGGGPLLDMGPYYVAALIQLLGPIRSVVGAASRLRSERTITSGTRTGESIPVAVQTHVSGVLEHASGALSTITTSFDGVATTAAPIEVHGESATLAVPDPNNFDGEVRLFERGTRAWQALEVSAGYVGSSRGAGLLDFVAAGRDHAPGRASGDIALHSLDAMTALLASAEAGRRIELTTSVQRPQPVPLTPLAEWKAGFVREWRPDS